MEHPSLEGSKEVCGLTPWQIIQGRGRAPESRGPGSGSSTKVGRQIKHRIRPQRNTLFDSWGIDSPTTMENNIKKESILMFGNNRSRKQNNSYRCASHNINNIPEKAFWQKSKEITEMALGKDSADIRMWQEVGLYWPKVEKINKWHNRLRGRSHGVASVFGYNTLEDNITNTRQFGGTAVITNNRLTSIKNQTGTDSRGLGRWSWIRCGKNNKYTTFISAYRPVTATSGGGATVYDQHLRHLEEGTDPRKVMLRELAEFVTEMQQKGDVIIIGMDTNDKIYGSTIRNFMKELNLHDALAALHGNKCPPTTKFTEIGGPIDIIMCSEHIIPQAAGMDYYGGSLSNHAWLWADFDKKDLFGTEFKEYKIYEYRLNADDPRQSKRYNDKSLHQLRKAKIPERLEELMEVHKGSFGHEEIKEYEKILKEVTDIRKEVTASLRRSFTGQIPWSPEWKKAQKEKALWCQLQKRWKIKRGEIRGRASLSEIRRLMRATGNTDALTYSKELVDIKVKQSIAKYNQSCKEAYQLEQSFLLTLDEAKAEVNQTSIEIETAKRKAIENQREAGKALARMKRAERPRVSKVYFTQGGHRIECTKKEEIEEACIYENRKRFSQVRDTPPMQPEITSLVGFCAEKEFASEILEGTADLSTIQDKYLRLVLEYMRQPKIIQARGMLSGTISIEEHIEGWKKQKRKTSSERSNLEFNDMKAAALGVKMATIDRDLRQLPYRHGFAPENHTAFTDFQILKKAAVYDVEKMRTIQLMPAAFNMNNKKTGREIMANAERFNLLPDEQAGSRKNHRANLTTLNKVLTNDIIRARRIPSVIIFNDAKSCYDRIVLWIAALAMRRLGATKESTLEMTKTLQQASHKICTAYGDSSNTYGGNDSFPPLQGVGQGNGAGPAIWVAISTILLTIMRTKGFGFSILSAVSLNALVIAGFAFVDDADIIHAAIDPKTNNLEVLQTAQKALDTWEGTLGATGGAIGADDGNKAFWYFLDFKFWNGKWRYLEKDKLLGDLWVKNYDGKRVQLNRIEPDEARETLGIFIAMDGNRHKQIEYLQQKARIYKEQLRTGVIEKRHAWYSYTASFSKILEYPMEAIDLTRKEWDGIIKIFLGTLLSKAGIARTFPRLGVFSSGRFQGLGLEHPYYTQKIKHINVLMGVEGLNNQTASLLKAAWEECQEESGVIGNLTKAPLDLIRITTNSWVKSTVTFAIEHDIHIYFPAADRVLQRSRDTSIMKEFYELDLEIETLYQLNQCRLWLGANTLADISSADGTRPLLSNNLEILSERFSKGSIKRRRPRKDQINWKLWDNMMTRCKLKASSGMWIEDLGTWKDQEVRQWRHQYSKAVDRMYVLHGQVWMEYVRLPQTRRSRAVTGVFVQKGILMEALPYDLVRSDAYRLDFTKIRLCGVDKEYTWKKIDTPLRGWEDEIHKLEKWSLESITCNHDGKVIAKAIQDGTALAVSDGSFKHDRGTSAALIEDYGVKESRMIITNRVPGKMGDHNPYRAEACGVLGIITCIEAICKKFNIQSGSIRIGLDGESVILALRRQVLSTNQDSFDILQVIKHKIKKLKVQVNMFWIKGHQDNKGKKLDDLPYDSQLNIMCDGLAKAYWSETKYRNDNFESKRVSHIGCHLRCIRAFFTKVDKEKMYDLTYGLRNSTDYCERRVPLNYGSSEDINWEAIHKAAEGLKLGQKHWLAKHIAGMSAVGTTMRRRGDWNHDKCPICLMEIETNDHVLLCKDRRARNKWKEGVATLLESLEKMNTEPCIQRIIENRLLAWPRETHHKFIYDEMPGITRQAMEAQDLLGWRAFIYGRTSTLWQDAQKEWIIQDSTKWKITHTTWSANLVKGLFHLIRGMWDHRNLILHDKDHKWKKDRRKVWNKEIRQFYRLFKTKHWNKKDERFFAKSRKTVLSYDDGQKQQWLESVQMAYNRRPSGPSQNTSRDRTLLEWLTKEETGQR